MKILLEAVEKTNRRYHLLKKGDGVVLGLSGGPDSTALLLILLKLQKKYGLKIYAAHLNHDISPRDSRKFERFSEKLAARLGVPFYKKKVSLKKLAHTRRRTLEETGRIERYRFFCEVARKTKSQKIATAHTLDDQAETVLMRIARGAGLRGLAGIPAIRKEGPFVLIRPLIGIPKKEITHYLKKAREPFCHDPSNRQNLFTRNRVRNNLIPWMEKQLNPRLKESLSDLAAICGQINRLLETLSDTALKNCLIRKTGRSLALSVPKLKRLDAAVRSETLFRALGVLTGERLRFGAAHIDAIIGILDSSEGNLQTHLPGGLVAARKNQTLRIFDTSSK